jgi:Mce-associated membrane protein
MTEQVPIDPTPTELERRTAPWAPVAALLSVATVLIALALLALVRSHTLRHDGPLANQALVNRGATSQVSTQVSTAVTQVLSYDYTKPQVAAQAARHWLAGDAPKQYQLLFQQLQKAAKGQQLTTIAKIRSIGVTSLRGGIAQLLVYVDQQSTRASDGESSVSGAQVEIQATRHGTTWKITEFNPL